MFLNQYMAQYIVMDGKSLINLECVFYNILSWKTSIVLGICNSAMSGWSSDLHRE